MSEDNPSVRDILVSIGYSPKDSGSGYSCRPLYRDSDSDTVMSVDKKTGLWYDFKDCIGGNLSQLVEITLKVSSAEAFKILNDKNFSTQAEAQESESLIVEPKTWDESVLLRLKKDNCYWNQRGIPDHVLTQFRGGVATSGRLAWRYVFPIFDELGRIIGFTGRDLFKKSDRVKWKILGHKKQFCYPFHLNQQILIDEQEVILIESIGDGLSLASAQIKNFLVLFGLALNPTIIKALIKVNPKRIIIAVNDDSQTGFAGNKAALKIRKELLNYFDPESIIEHLPTKNDFNEMTPEEILTWKSQIPK